MEVALEGVYAGATRARFAIPVQSQDAGAKGESEWTSCFKGDVPDPRSICACHASANLPGINSLKGYAPKSRERLATRILLAIR